MMATVNSKHKVFACADSTSTYSVYTKLVSHASINVIKNGYIGLDYYGKFRYRKRLVHDSLRYHIWNNFVNLFASVLLNINYCKS